MDSFALFMLRKCELVKETLVPLFSFFEIPDELRDKVIELFNDLRTALRTEMLKKEEDYEDLERIRLKKLSKLEQVLKNFDNLSDAQIKNMIMTNQLEETKETREELREDLLRLMKEEKEDRPLERWLAVKEKMVKRRMDIQLIKDELDLPSAFYDILEILARDSARIEADNKLKRYASLKRRILD